MLCPAQQRYDPCAAELQMGNLVSRHELEPIEIFLLVGVPRRYRRQADGRHGEFRGRVRGIDNLKVRAGKRQAIQVKHALHVLQIDLHASPYSTTAPTTSAMLCCNSTSSVRLHTSAT